MAGLEGLARALTVEALDLRRDRERALASRTAAGHARNALGYALSLYCLLRCVRETLALLWPACPVLEAWAAHVVHS